MTEPAHNRLHFGVAPSALAGVRATVAALHLPSDGVVVEASGPIRSTQQTLQDQVTPLVAGLKFEALDPNTQTFRPPCTLGGQVRKAVYFASGR